MCTLHQIDTQKAEAFGGKLVDMLNHGALAVMISMGHRTGLFDTLSTLPPATSVEIAEAAGHSERLKILIAYLEKRAKGLQNNLSPVQQFIKQLIHRQGSPDIHEMAKKSFLSIRQFQRKFKANAGFSCKTFNRLLRYSTTLGFYKDPDKSLSEIAHLSGYFDQAHFIKDFKDFTGYKPKTYFSGKAEGTAFKDV